ncbi:GAF domain-containing protein [Pseudanabaena sp. PCC 6802]|uniref:GAF domain-containing protein n=1 Tax=Pseudanabaena sp. PCC 6802 TaxID=118173 RepID=UPI0003665FB8|nr:GAF domain-containing protein [Pseudanabaena sp. PCC 6802]
MSEVPQPDMQFNTLQQAAYQSAAPAARFFEQNEQQQAEQLEQIEPQAMLLLQAKAQEKAMLRQKALVKITNRIRRSLDFSEICQTATEEVRQLIEVDRVTIYQFNPDWSGNFLFESISEGWKPLVGALPAIEDTHFMETHGGRYANNETLAISDICTAEYSDWHVALLEEFQAKAYAIAPIFQGDRLWGLLSAFQNTAPRHWNVDEVDLLAQIGELLGIALQQAESVQQMQSQALELQKVVAELHLSQRELIQTEKMATLGQPIASVAHEINNSLSAIQTAATNVQDFLEAGLGELPHLHQYLSPQEQESFFQLVDRAIHTQGFMASIESRALRRKIATEIEPYNFEDARYIAELLIDMGVDEERIELLQPLLNSDRADWAIRLAYSLTRSFTNNQTILEAVERSSKMVSALKSYTKVEQNTEKHEKL